MTVSLSQIFSVALVLAVVYYILGLLVSALVKLILDGFETKGKIFEGFLKRNLEDAVSATKRLTVDELKNMPQINSLRPVRYKNIFGLFTGQLKLSDYVERIPPKNLVDALFDFEGTARNAKDKVDSIIALLPDEITNLNQEKVKFTPKEKLGAIAGEAYQDVEKLRAKLETWAEGLMEQAAQEFKAQARRIVLLISFLVAVVLGVDTLDIAQRAWYDAQLTQAADAYAEVILQSSDDENTKNAKIDALYGTLDEMKVVNFQWFLRPAANETRNEPTLGSPYTQWTLTLPYSLWLLLKIAGLAITGLAVSQGSSFWYDIIRQIKGEQKSTSAKASAEEGGLLQVPSAAGIRYGILPTAPAAPTEPPPAEPVG